MLPVLMTMTNPQDDYSVVIAQIIDDQVRFVFVCAHWRIDLVAQPGSSGKVCKKRECGGQAIMIFVGLGKAEQHQTFNEDRLDVAGCRLR